MALMNIDEVYQLVETDKPKLIYLSGKTSTGKSTFAKKIVQSFGYKVIELDQLVQSSVIKPFKLTDEGSTFVEVYRGRDKMEWILQFVRTTRDLIEKHIQKEERLIVEGALAHPVTLSELFAGYSDFTFIYFHPKYFNNYIRNITARFVTTNKQNKSGLPSAFWKLIDPVEFDSFCKSRFLTDNLSQSIRKYAVLSQQESNKRVKTFIKYFKDIKVVEI